MITLEILTNNTKTKYGICVSGTNITQVTFLSTTSSGINYLVNRYILILQEFFWGNSYETINQSTLSSFSLGGGE